MGLEFLATDYQNYFMAELYYDGKVSLFHKVDSKWSTVWEQNMPNLVKTGPGDPGPSCDAAPGSSSRP